MHVYMYMSIYVCVYAFCEIHGVYGSPGLNLLIVFFCSLLFALVAVLLVASDPRSRLVGPKGRVVALEPFYASFVTTSA